MDSESTFPHDHQLIDTPDHGKVMSFTNEISQEQAVPAPQRKTRRFGRRVTGRRKFLSLAGGAVAGTVVGLELAKHLPQTSSLPPHEIPPVSHAAELTVVNAATLAAEKIRDMKKTEHAPFLKMVALGIKENKLGDILPQFRKYYEQYQGQESMIARASNIQQEIQQALQDPRLAPLQLTDQDRSLFLAILLPTAAKESSFNPTAENGAKNEENKAIGLLQVKNSAAKEAAKRLGIEKYDLKNVKDNIVLATAILKRNLNLFPNLGMALAAYNLGEGKVGRAIQVHAKNDLKIPEEKVDEDFETMGLDGKSPPASTSYTNEYKISWHDLTQSPNVVNDFKNQNYNAYELDYYDQIVAWAMVFNPNQFKGFTQLMLENTDKPKEDLWQKVKQIVRR
jgi:soluble lytic murein transglycosylase-like protein